MAAVSRHEPTVRVFDVQRAEACKATQNVVDVVTDIGTQQFIVPASFKKAAQSEQACEWLEADRKALDAILMYPGNRLVPLSVPGDAGLPIARCVSQRKIKVDAATGRLESRNSFKSRHCVDGGHLKMLLARQGIGTTSDASSSVADEMLVKMLLADTALRDRTLLKADVPNAYPQGKRTGRPLTYMYMPEAFRDMRSDDGEQLCIELATPMWGERQAGFEWQLELERTLESLGWRRAENVPACWWYKGAEGDATLITIVDDMLFSESRESNYSISERTVAKLSALYGDLRPGRAPDSFAGYSIDRTAGRIRISLPQKLIQAAREHLPGLLDTATDDERKVVANLPSCKKLEAMADAMIMPERRKSGLTPLQRSTQALIGSLKFIERCHPRASLMLHRLSCVMTCPPPEAYTVARALLNSLYAERDVGITYGRNGVPERGDEYELKGQLSSNIVDLNGAAPMELEAMADATLNLGSKRLRPADHLRRRCRLPRHQEDRADRRLLHGDRGDSEREGGGAGRRGARDSASVRHPTHPAHPHRDGQPGQLQGGHRHRLPFAVEALPSALLRAEAAHRLGRCDNAPRTGRTDAGRLPDEMARPRQDTRICGVHDWQARRSYSWR